VVVVAAVIALGLIGVSLGFALTSTSTSTPRATPALVGAARSPVTAATVPTTAPVTTGARPAPGPVPPGSVRCGDGSAAKAYSDCATSEATQAIELSLKPPPVSAGDLATAQAAARASNGDAAVSSRLGEPGSGQATSVAEQATSAAQWLQTRLAAQQNAGQGYTS
jgi:hypothetical protein